MEFKLDELVNTVGEMASGAAKATTGLVKKSQDRVNEMALSSKLSKMQRQLGALVYTLRKNEEENEPMVAWYVAEIDRIKAEMGKKSKNEKFDESEQEVFVYGTPEEQEDGAMFCDGDRDELS